MAHLASNLVSINLPLPPNHYSSLFGSSSFQNYDTTTFTSKRKRDINHFSIFRESILLDLCRTQRWVEAIQRINTHPYEASLVPIDDHSSKRFRFNSNADPFFTIGVEGGKEILYHETALGIVCSSKQTEAEQINRVIKELVHKCPAQIRVSQGVSGHTPLRDAILNPQCTPGILQVLLDADAAAGNYYMDSSPACLKKDSNGFLPIDHLIMKVQSGSPQAIDMLKTFIQSQSLRPVNHEDYTSPLIRLLTIDACSNRNDIPSSGDRTRLFRILEVSKCLLDREPSLLYDCSRATGCSPMHLAIRNYGNFLPLIQELSSRDTSCRLMKLHNNYGDLPIHVASSIGVPLDILSFIIRKTTVSSQERTNGPNLVWTKNNFGYTPMDQEFFNYIELGSNLSHARTLYPLKPRGTRQHEYYQNVFRESIDQITAGQSLDHETTQQERYNEARKTLGDFIERMSLIISSAFTTSIVPPLERNLLHDACKLCSPNGPTLTLPLLKLVLWLNHEDLLKCDYKGNLPLHYALCHATTTASQESNTTQIHDWEAFCLQLVDTAPESCKIVNQNARLPLHILLDSMRKNSCNESSKVSQELVDKLLQHFPQSIGTRDPYTNLDPFMLASEDTNLSYYLLSQSPFLCLLKNQSSRTF